MSAFRWTTALVAASLFAIGAPANAAGTNAPLVTEGIPSCIVNGRGPTLWMTVGLAIVNGKRQVRSAQAIAAIVARNDRTDTLGWYALDDSGDAWVLMQKDAVARKDVIAWLGSKAASYAASMGPLGTPKSLPQSLVLTPCNDAPLRYGTQQPL